MKVFPFLFSTVAGLLFIGSLQQVRAQQGQRGEVQDQEFVIRKDRVLTLPKQNRPFAPVPVLPTPKSESQFTYTVTPFYLATQPEAIEVEPAVRNFPRKQQELYPGFVRAGFGNFISPLLEARYNLWEEQDFALGGYLKHQGFYRGPVDGANSAEHLTEMGADARWFTDYFTFHGNLRYRRDEFRFYGFDPENEVLQLLNFTPDVNVLQEVGLSGKIQPIDQDAPLQYVASFDVRNLTDGFRASEAAASFTTNVHYRFENGFEVGFNSFLETTSPEDVPYQGISRNFYRINPQVRYRANGLDVVAGANMVIENDVTENKPSDFHIFPQLRASYAVVDALGVFAGFEGDMLRNTYLSFVRENPFLGPSEQLLNTRQQFRASAGVQGQIDGTFRYKAGLALANLQNFHLFGNQASDSTRFELLYDTDTRVLEYFGEVSFEFEDWYKVSGSAKYFHYTLTDFVAAFGRPDVEIRIQNEFKPADKWLIQANVLYLGGITGFNAQAPLLNFDAPVIGIAPEVLPAVIDVQLHADYRISPRVSAFVTGNNLLNRSNARFLNYPARGIQGIAGVTIQF